MPPSFIPSKDHSLVAYAASDALLVKVFEQRNGVFAGYADEVFESANVDFGGLGFLRGYELAQPLQRSVMKYKIVCQLDQDAVAQEKSYQLLRTGLVDGKSVEHFFHQRDLQAGVGKSFFELFFGFGLVVF